MALRALFVALLIACSAPPAAGQADRSYPFRAGYVVPAEGDTLRGWVEDRIALERARVVNFKASEAAEPHAYYPDAALGYGFTDGARFVTRRVKPDPDASPRNVFVRVLVEGPRSLYAHAFQPGEDRYYVEGEGFPLEGLYQIEKEVHRDGRYVRRTQRLYAGTLTRAFQDCNAARNAVEDVRYTARSLTRAVIDYNRCVDPAYAPPVVRADVARSRIALHPGVRVGLGSSTLRWRRGKLGTDIQPYVGAFVEVEALNTEPGFSLLFDLSYRRATTGRIALALFGPDLFGDATLYTTGVLALGMGVKYERPLPIVSPFVAVQYLSGWVTGSDAESDRYSNVDSPNSEGGIAVDVGVTRRLYGETDLVLGVRGEWTSMKDEILYIPFGPAYFGRRSATVLLSLRF